MPARARSQPFRAGRFGYMLLGKRKGAAEIYASDLVGQRDFSGQPTLKIARAARRSKGHCFPDLSVCDIEKLGGRDFDVVIFAGVY